MKLNKLLLVVLLTAILIGIPVAAFAQTSGRSIVSEDIGTQTRYLRKVLFSDDNLNRYPIMRYVDTLLTLNGTWYLDKTFAVSTFNEETSTITSRAQYKFNSAVGNPGTLQTIFDFPKTKLTGISTFNINESAFAMSFANPIDMMYWEFDMVKNQLQAQKDIPMMKASDIAETIAKFEQAQAMLQLVGGKEGLKRMFGNELMVVLNDVNIERKSIDMAIIMKINGKKELMGLMQMGAGAGLTLNWTGPEKYGFKFAQLPIPAQGMPPVWMGMNDDWMVITLNPNDFYNIVREHPYKNAPDADFYMSMNGHKIGKMIQPILVKAEKEFEPYFPFDDLRGGLKINDFDFGNCSMMYNREGTTFNSIVNYDQRLGNSMVYGLSLTSAYLVKTLMQREMKITKH